MPDGLALEPMTARVVACWSEGIDPWVIQIWGGAEEFEARCFGYCLLVEGRIVSGAGTGTALVETETGVVAVDLVPAVAGAETVGVEDSDEIGLAGERALDAVWRINCGGSGYRDTSGRDWLADRFFVGGSSADFGMRALLKRLGVDPVKDATILQIGDEPARIAAVTSGNVEGTVVNAPFSSEAERLKLNVIADSVNPLPMTRAAWREVGGRAGKRTVEVEIVCSDPGEHRRRIESRVADIPGHALPAWADVVARDYRPWDRDLVRIDTARTGVDEAVATLFSYLERIGATPESF